MRKKIKSGEVCECYVIDFFVDNGQSKNSAGPFWYRDLAEKAAISLASRVNVTCINIRTKTVSRKGTEHHG